MKKIDISFWLIPVEEQKRKLQEIIDELADKFKSFPFIPHVTIFHFNYELNQSDLKNIKEETDKLLEKQKSFSLKVLKIDYSDIFTKTLFIQFEKNKDLILLYERFLNVFKKYSLYSLNPHLSLVYKNKMKEEDKMKIIKSLKLKDKIIFDKLKIIIKSGGSITEEKDILLWKEIYKKKFL
ncbi:MAG: hypothetical protein QHH09_03295 [Microgenomates group bacterium]|nr:hypothetical protein [Microgenomates group bacterium]